MYTSVAKETCYIKSDETITVKAKLENMLNHVGYFSGAKVKKAMDALEKTRN